MRAALYTAVWSLLILALLEACLFRPLHALGATYRQCGVASWYGYSGRPTANGERFNGSSMTAASRTLPFGTIVRVTDTATGRSVVVRINDRGPYVGGRIIDLSREAAHRLGIIPGGTARVCLSAPGDPGIGRKWDFVKPAAFLR